MKHHDRKGGQGERAVLVGVLLDAPVDPDHPLDELAGLAIPGDGITGRQGAAGRLREKRDAIADGVARGQLRRNGHRAQPVEMGKAFGHDGLAVVDDITELDHVATARAHIKPGKVGRARAVRVLHLHQHVGVAQ